VTVHSGGQPLDPRDPIRAALDTALRAAEEDETHTVANTLFPMNQWNPESPAEVLFERYLRILPALRKHAANRNGIYFARMIAFGDADPPINQIRHVLDTYRGGNHRNSALQFAIFDPSHDHTHQRQRGFPCLHQVALAADDGKLAVVGFYARQTLFQKAYGNYLGLFRLGTFLAHELKLTLTQVSCVATLGDLGASKAQTKVLAETLRPLVAPNEVVEGFHRGDGK
jgi:hypothetical protein